MISGFYAFHAFHGRGPVLNPVPENRARAATRHRSPIDSQVQFRRGSLRQKSSRREPRAVPDDLWDELLNSMGCVRDRALLLMWVSSGARANELLGLTLEDIDWAGGKFYVVSKGTRIKEAVPASPEALRTLAAYLDEAGVPEPGEPIWRTRRGSSRPLTYSAARRIIQRANERLGTNWTIHDLRHTLAMRLSADPDFKVEEIQKVMRHAQVTTTSIYQRPRLEDMINRLQEHYDKPAPVQVLTPGYDQNDIEAVFGG